MEHQLATLMDFIKKSERRHNEQLIQHGIHVKSQLSQVLSSTSPVKDATHSRGTHPSTADSKPMAAPPAPSPLHSVPVIPAVATKPSANPVPLQHNNQSNHSTHTKIDSQNANQSSTLFGQSDYSIACNGKVKFLELERYMKDKQLENDSMQQLEIFYTDLMSAIGYAFEFHLPFLPEFKELHPAIDFEKLFLQNLCGATLQKAASAFDRLGQIIKKFLKPPFIQTDKAPLASIVLKSNNKLSGWHLLTKLLQARVVLCGATPDYDLDTVRTSIKFDDDETFHMFYSRNQDLLNEYELTYGNQLYIPTFKITYRFVTELCRSMEYLIHLNQFQHSLLQHLQKYGDANNMILPPCTIQEVYDLLVRVRAPDTPTKLNTLTYLPPPSVAQDPTPPTTSVSSSQGLIAAMDIPSDCFHPEICAMVNPKQRCQACLRGYHDPNNCFLRGPAFRPKELNQRLNTYNQQFGDKPPKDHVPPEYKPLSLTAMHDKSSPRQARPPRKPFSGSTKVKFDDKKTSINTIEHTDDSVPTYTSDPPTNHDPYVGSFIHHEDNFHQYHVDESTPDIDVDSDPTICAMSTLLPHPPPSRPTRFYHQSYSSTTVDAILHNDISSRIRAYHQSVHNRPCKKFLRHHHANLLTLPPSYFHDFCDVSLMADGGANVWALTDRRLFYFYVEKESTIAQAGGTGMSSKAWGGVLIRLKQRIYLVAPVYHCPTNPRNIFSPGVLLDFCDFQKVVIDTHNSIHMKDHNGLDYDLPISVHNNLDYVSIKIVAMSPQPIPHLANHPHHRLHHDTFPATVASQDATHLRRSPRLLQQRNNQHSTLPTEPAHPHSLSTQPTNNITTPVPPIPPDSSPTTPLPSALIDHPTPSPIDSVPTDTPGIAPPLPLSTHDLTPSLLQPTKKSKTIISNPRLETVQQYRVPKEALMTIIHFYIDLHPQSSPRATAIYNINMLLNPNTSSPSMHHLTPSINHLAQPSSLPPLKTHESVVPMINNLYSATKSTVSNQEKYMFLHESLMHSSKSTIKKIIAKKLLRDLPSIKITEFLCSCDICKLSKPKKLPRGLNWDVSHLAPFQLLHFDFSFFTEESLRGFTSALDVICSSTSYPIGFPCKSKAPPIHATKWLLRVLRSRGYTPCFCHVDEGGELANSSEFCQMLMDEGLVMSTTGGGNSINNGKVERPNQTKANMIRSMLSTMTTMFGHTLPKNMSIQKFWCFAYQHSNFILRRTYNAARDEIPMFLVHKKRPSALELVIPGSIMTVINPNKAMLPKLSENRARSCYFLSFGNHVKSFIYWDPSTSSYKRSYHSVIDTTSTLARLKTRYVFQSNVSIPTSPSPSSTVTLPTFHRLATPFHQDMIHTVSLTLPPFPQPIGFVLEDDSIFNLPFIRKAVLGTYAYTAIPSKLRNNHFILHLNGDSPITAYFV
jgi:hypothetical protein